MVEHGVGLHEEAVEDYDHETGQERREFYTELGREVLVGRAKQTIIDFDAEFDGGPGVGSLLSIGAVAPTGEEFYVELKPQTNSYILSMKNFCDKMGLTREYLEESGVPADEAARRFRDWLVEIRDKYSRPVVGAAFNSPNDWVHVDALLAKLHLAEGGNDDESVGTAQPRYNPMGVAPIDTKAFALGILPVGDNDEEILDWSSTSKSRLPEVVKPDLDFTHNALEDAKYQQLQHFAMWGMKVAGKFPELDGVIRNRLSERKRAQIGQLAAGASE